MASNPKRLRVVGAWHEEPATRVLEIACIEGEPFDVVGGKYVIVHTGLVLGDKAVKRAYSLMPAEGRPGRARLAVKRLGGPGSAALHALAVGDELGFSGPWGKLVPEGGLAPRTLLVATDTGVTSALGIVEQAALGGLRGEALASGSASSSGSGSAPLEVLWLRAERDTFLGLDAVRARLTRAGARLVVATIPGPGEPSRAATGLALVTGRAEETSATHVVATGDGAIVHPLRAELPARVPSVVDVRIECFFNNPEKKSV